jgi:hypothetical protein
MATPRHLIISVDYEIFGNGTGDVRQHMIEPTERMARICEAHHAPLTVFFEVEEYLAFEKYGPQLTADLGYDPAKLIRNQIADLARRGHDIQLHLHSEWVGARYENRTWVLFPEHPTVDSVFADQGEVTKYIAERKAAIEEILSTAGSKQKVQVYRAGAFSAQPGPRLLGALRANDFIIDSSVVKGLTRCYRNGGFDYRHAPSAKRPWRISNDVAVEDNNGPLWEFPIYSEMGRRWQQLTIGRLKAKFSKNVPKERRDQMMDQLNVRRTPLGIARFLAAPIPIKLDYHNLTASKLFKMVQSSPAPPQGLPDVSVLIGHSKEHIDDAPLNDFLGLAGRNSVFKVVTFGDIAAEMRESFSQPERSAAAAAQVN